MCILSKKIIFGILLLSFDVFSLTISLNGSSWAGSCLGSQYITYSEPLNFPNRGSSVFSATRTEPDVGFPGHTPNFLQGNVLESKIISKEDGFKIGGFYHPFSTNYQLLVEVRNSQGVIIPTTYDASNLHYLFESQIVLNTNDFLDIKITTLENQDAYKSPSPRWANTWSAIISPRFDSPPLKKNGTQMSPTQYLLTMPLSGHYQKNISLSFNNLSLIRGKTIKIKDIKLSDFGTPTTSGLDIIPSDWGPRSSSLDIFYMSHQIL